MKLLFKETNYHCVGSKYSYHHHRCYRSIFSAHHLDMFGVSLVEIKKAGNLVEFYIHTHTTCYDEHACGEIDPVL